MSTQIFINLPVKNLKQSMAFYDSIGFKNNPQFTDDTAACMVLSDSIFVMLLTHDKFRHFTPKTIIDARKTAGVINALAVGSNSELNEFMKKAIEAGANEYREPEDYGFMQQRSFEDLDGHNWEVFYMDMSKFPQTEVAVQ